VLATIATSFQKVRRIGGGRKQEKFAGVSGNGGKRTLFDEVSAQKM
jgi:hypothetical protein